MGNHASDQGQGQDQAKLETGKINTDFTRQMGDKS